MISVKHMKGAITVKVVLKAIKELNCSFTVCVNDSGWARCIKDCFGGPMAAMFILRESSNFVAKESVASMVWFEFSSIRGPAMKFIKSIYVNDFLLA